MASFIVKADYFDRILLAILGCCERRVWLMYYYFLTVR
jgi:hypothetical protein